MKKEILLTMLVLMLSVVTVKAQSNFIKTDANFIVKADGFDAPFSPVKRTQVTASPRRISLDANEKIMGFYTGDSIGSSNYALGMKTAGDYKAAILFDSDFIGKFVTGQITKVRFALWTSVGASTLRIYKITDNDGMTEVSTTAVDSTAKGWNDVTLATPVTLERDAAYLVAYDYTQVSGVYPLAIDYDINENTDQVSGLYFYGDLDGTGAAWYAMGTSYGNFLIQAVVSGGLFSDDDVVLKDLHATPFRKAGEQLSFTYKIRNDGNNIPTSYALKVKIDGQEVPATMSLPTLTSNYQEITGECTLPEDMAKGSHTLSVTVDKINEATPTVNTDDDVVTTEFKVYTESVAHQKQLVEHFTSQYCIYCQYGYNMLNALMSERNDIAWVSIHGNMGTNAVDEYTISESDTLISFSISGFPSAAFNRYYIPETSINAYGKIGVVINYGTYTTQAAALFSEILDEENSAVPAFASVDISSTYDEATRNLDIKVSGEAVSDFSTLFGEDAVLTVYLTEDSLKSKQANPQGTWTYNYAHNHVLRAVVTAPLGDAINWNGNSYENTYSTTLNSGWNAANMNVVAFISRPIIYDNSEEVFTTSDYDAYVTNTEVVKIGASTGVSGVVGDFNAKVVARYTTDGRKVSAPVKGLNIVKMSDGRTVKVMVK